jgi:AraC-like DNA-binding protein
VFTAGAEFLWIKFKLGVFMPHLPLKDFLDLETPLPEAGSQSFWLKGCARPFPSADNVETFVQRLVREEVLMHDPVVERLISDQPQQLSSRTLRERFLRATGLSQVHIRQHLRANQAVDLLAQGTAILDVVEQLGYFDQAHLTHSLKRFVGRTPAQILGPLCQPTGNPSGPA